MVLRALAVPVGFAVLAAFFDAPFVHFHQHADTEHARVAHHGSGLAGHTHAVSPATSVPGWYAAPDGDDDAVFLTWVPSTPHAQPVTIALPPAAPVLAVATVAAGSVMLPSPRSHDPPHLRSTSPRSPPYDPPSSEV